MPHAGLRLGTLPAAFLLSSALLVAGSATPVAVAQQVMTFTSSGPAGGGSFRAPVTTRDVDRFASVLGLSPDQVESARAMVETAVAEFNTASKAAREQMAEIEAEFQESRDPSIFRDKMPAITRKLSEKRSEIEKQVLGDLRLTLTPEQDANWDRLERLRRREANVSGMMGISGESVDLVKVGEKVGVISGPVFAGAGEQVKPLFEQYERELDAAIQAKQKAMTEARPPAEGNFDRDAMAKAMEAVREKSVALREVNQKFARQIAGVLSEGDRSKWEQEVKKQTFPEVYRETYASRAMKAALAMDDLSSEQRSQVQSAMERFERELAPANEALAKAIAEADDSGARGGMVGGAGGPMMVRMGDEPEAVKAARAARRDIEKKAMESVNATLTESQRSKLPPRRAPRGPGAEQIDGEEGGAAEIMEIRVRE